jgi:hypothetical protein
MVSIKRALAFGGTEFGSANRFRTSITLVNHTPQLAELSKYPASDFLVPRVPTKRTRRVPSPFCR